MRGLAPAQGAAGVGCVAGAARVRARLKLADAETEHGRRLTRQNLLSIPCHAAAPSFALTVCALCALSSRRAHPNPYPTPWVGCAVGRAVVQTKPRCCLCPSRPVAAGSKDALVKLWCPKSGRCLATLHGHKGTIMQTQWNQNGNWVLTASRDQTCKARCLLPDSCPGLRARPRLSASLMLFVAALAAYSRAWQAKG